MSYAVDFGFKKHDQWIWIINQTRALVSGESMCIQSQFQYLATQSSYDTPNGFSFFENSWTAYTHKSSNCKKYWEKEK